jgi:hypothetical protein
MTASPTCWASYGGLLAASDQRPERMAFIS